MSSLSSLSYTITADNTQITDNYILVLGNQNEITGHGCTVRGHKNTIIGNETNVIGNRNIIVGERCLGNGTHNKIYGKDSRMEGRFNIYYNAENGEKSWSPPCETVISASSRYAPQTRRDAHAEQAPLTVGGLIESIVGRSRQMNDEEVSRLLNSSSSSSARPPLKRARKAANKTETTLLECFIALKEERLHELTDKDKLDTLRDSDSDHCSICLENKRRIQFLPCKQVPTCFKCTQELFERATIGTSPKCPLCSTEAQDFNLVEL